MPVPQSMHAAASHGFYPMPTTTPSPRTSPPCGARFFATKLHKLSDPAARTAAYRAFIAIPQPPAHKGSVIKTTLRAATLREVAWSTTLGRPEDRFAVRVTAHAPVSEVGAFDRVLATTDEIFRGDSGETDPEAPTDAMPLPPPRYEEATSAVSCVSATKSIVRAPATKFRADRDESAADAGLLGVLRLTTLVCGRRAAQHLRHYVSVATAAPTAHADHGSDEKPAFTTPTVHTPGILEHMLRSAERYLRAKYGAGAASGPTGAADEVRVVAMASDLPLRLALKALGFRVVEDHPLGSGDDELRVYAIPVGEV
ncbi:hypothetical protein H9P43_010034 [Blastocladiella emersonii ATCC 22665]|nr:hypothetical protein H9P43_010034 [Blastocladiella emersonii ATCC 22665]